MKLAILTKLASWIVNKLVRIMSKAYPQRSCKKGEKKREHPLKNGGVSGSSPAVWAVGLGDAVFRDGREKNRLWVVRDTNKGYAGVQKKRKKVGGLFF